MSGAIRNLILSLVVFSAIIVGLTTFYGGLLGSYGANVEDISYISAAGDMNAQISQYKSSVEAVRYTGNPLVDTALNLPFYIINGIWNTLLTVMNTINIFNSITADIGQIIGIPYWFEGMIIAALTIILIFELISIYMKWDV